MVWTGRCLFSFSMALMANGAARSPYVPVNRETVALHCNYLAFEFVHLCGPVCVAGCRKTAGQGMTLGLLFASGWVPGLYSRDAVQLVGLVLGSRSSYLR